MERIRSSQVRVGSEPVGSDMFMTQHLMTSLLKKTCAFPLLCACKSPPGALGWRFRTRLIASSRLVVSLITLVKNKQKAEVNTYKFFKSNL